MSLSLYALQHVKRMPGGSQAHLLRASDGNFYVTKMIGNPQHTRVLANEMLASRLGKWLGLPVSDVAAIEISEWLIENTPDFYIKLAGRQVKCSSGRHLGSRYVVDPLDDGVVFDCLPENMFHRVTNAADFAKMIVLDKWVGNCDGRQAVFSKTARQRRYRATFIDQGCSFNAGQWDFPDMPLHGVYYQNHVYAGVTGWESFEPVLSRAEEADRVDLWRCAGPILPEWYDNDSHALQGLVDRLYERRGKIRDLIAAFRGSRRNPFPNWKQSMTCVVSVPASACNASV